MLALLLLLACSSPLSQARDLADQGQVSQALEQLRAYVQSNPDSAAGWEALGDVHLEAALASEREAHLSSALEAYSQAHEALPHHGIYWAKLALVQHLLGDEAASETARQAWNRTHVAAALPLTDDAVALGEGVAQTPLEVGSWQALPSWGQPGPGGSFVVRSERTPVRPEEAEAPDPEPLDAGYQGTIRRLDGGRVFFDDLARPRHVDAVGYLDGFKYCDQPYGQMTCRGRLVHERDAPVHAGPCWHDPATAEDEEHTAEDLERLEAERELEDPERIRLNSLKCVAGPPPAQAEHCPDLPGSCQVSYQRIEYPALSVAREAVWLVPAGTPSPAHALGLTENPQLLAHLGQGELATGLPEPLVRWAARPDGRLPERWEADEGHLVLVWEGEHGVFTVRDGILASWER